MIKCLSYVKISISYRLIIHIRLDPWNISISVTRHHFQLWSKSANVLLNIFIFLSQYYQILRMQQTASFAWAFKPNYLLVLIHNYIIIVYVGVLRIYKVIIIKIVSKDFVYYCKLSNYNVLLYLKSQTILEYAFN